MVTVPLLSFVVIAYNVQPYIIQCLQSVKAQTLDDFEVIVVDDASTDGTLECITREVADDQRFHIIAKSEMKVHTLPGELVRWRPKDSMCTSLMVMTVSVPYYANRYPC